VDADVAKALKAIQSDLKDVQKEIKTMRDILDDHEKSLKESWSLFGDAIRHLNKDGGLAVESLERRVEKLEKVVKVNRLD
jgi:uncharacterized coiled-coil DUF342 family protein